MLAARILAVLGVLFTVLSLLAGYIRFQGLDTDTVTETAGLLIEDKEVRDQVAASLVDALYANIDVAAALEERLPPDQKGLAGPVAAGLREFSDRAATRMLERPRVQALWVNTVTQAHTQLINVLDDDVGRLSTEDGAVVLDLQPLVIQLGERVAVVGDVAEQLGPDAGKVEIMEAEQLETAQDLTQILKFLGSWLWLLPIALWALALWLARDRRRSILRMIAVGSILAGLLVLVRAQPRRLVHRRLTRSVHGGAACGRGRLGHPDQAAPRRRLHADRPGRDRARRALAGRYLGERRLRAERPRAVPGTRRHRLRRRRRPVPPAAVVEPDRADHAGAADARRCARARSRRRVAATPDRPRGPDPPPPDLGGSMRMGRVRGRTPEQDKLAAFERLGRLREQGVLTDEEFAAEKAQLVRQ